MWCLFERPAPVPGQTKRQLWVPRLGDRAPNTRSDPLGLPFTGLVKIPGSSCIVHCACIMSRKYRHSCLRGSLSEFVYVYSTRQSNTAVFLWQLDNHGQDYIKPEQTFKSGTYSKNVVKPSLYKLEAKLANNEIMSNFALPKISVFCFSVVCKSWPFQFPKMARKQLVYMQYHSLFHILISTVYNTLV